MKLWGVLCAVLVAGGALLADVVVTAKQSDCLSDGDGMGTVVVRVEDCVLVMLHRGVEFNCCLEYEPRVGVEGDHITIEEIDNGPLCDCICPFDLEVRIEGLEPGTYAVTVHAFRHAEPIEYTVSVPACGAFVIAAPQVWAVMGTPGVEVPVLATNPEPLQGFSFGVTFPLEHARMADITLRETVTEKVGAEFTALTIYNGESRDPPAYRHGWATFAVVLDFEPPFEGQTIPSGNAQPIARLVYDILPPGDLTPRSISVPFVDSEGRPPVAVVYTVRGMDVYPVRENGIIQLRWPAVFIRGDVNDDGVVSISDPIYLLSHLFGGGPVPPCEDAADGNDDGALDLADAIAILRYLFAGGSIPAPSPPGPPGYDPTLDELGCERGRDDHVILPPFFHE